MLELAARIDDALAAGRRLAVATLVRIDGSAPRQLGATMFVDDAGRVVGSVSGGCVEGALVGVCEQVLDAGAATIARFGISDDDAFAVGLACGGEIDVLVRPIDPHGATATDAAPDRARARQGRSAAVATVIAGPSAMIGRSLGGDADAATLSDALFAAAGVPELNVARIEAERQARLISGRSGLLAVPCAREQVEIFFDVAQPPARMFVFGAVDFAAALADAAHLLGYRVTVCDARETFATPERFPGAHEVVVDWPHRLLAASEADGSLDARSVVVSLTHDEKFDLPLLEFALARPFAYVGAMGSRRTHERRVAALRARGVSEEQLARLHSPIGLDLGAATPEETAVSILAEIIAERTGASARRLSATDGPIHARVAPSRVE